MEIERVIFTENKNFEHLFLNFCRFNSSRKQLCGNEFQSFTTYDRKDDDTGQIETIFEWYDLKSQPQIKNYSFINLILY